MVKILWILGLSALSGILYAISGHGGFKNAKMLRRMGIPVLCYIPTCIVICGVSGWWAYIISAGFLSLALTTYHDYLAPDGSSENWLCWVMTGFCYGASSFPLIWVGIAWWVILLRAIVLAILTCIWSEINGQARVEEMGRGFFPIATLLIFLI